MKPIERFGIVAAVSRDGVIGLNGKLPWKLPGDRRAFKQLTRDRILVIGRATLEEVDGGKPTAPHIRHVSDAIVVSTTLPAASAASDEDAAAAAATDDGGGGSAGTSSLSSSCAIHVVRSFPEALVLARELVSARDAGEQQRQQETSGSEGQQDGEGSESSEGTSASSDATSLQCWVAGGERIYHEALLHPSAERLHLTLVDVDVLKKGSSGDAGEENHQGSVARFPDKYRWDNRFRLDSEKSIVDETSGVSYTELVYQRIRGGRS